MSNDQRQIEEKLENVQWNALIQFPKLKCSMEVRLPSKIEGDFLVYSSSSSVSHKVYLDPFKLRGVVGNERNLVYLSDVIITNGSWIQHLYKGGNFNACLCIYSGVC